MPTAYNEFYIGFLEFRAYAGGETIDKVKNGQEIDPDDPTTQTCPLPINLRTVEFTVPEFKRTTSISDQLNQLVVPCAAQSFRHSTGTNPDDPDSCPQETAASSNNQSPKDNLLAKVVKFCKNLIENNPFVEKIKTTVKISLEKINPLKAAWAAEKLQCATLIAPGKEGTAPYCSVPEKKSDPPDAPNIFPGECDNKVSPNKLDSGQNVVCTFTVSGTVEAPVEERIDADGKIQKVAIVWVYPVFGIPFLAEIWNNTTYSSEKEQGSVVSLQKTGRPGVYTFFTPQAAFGEGFDQIELQNMCDAGNDRACSTLEEIEKICNAAAPGSIPVTEDCYKAITNFKLLPGEAKSDSGKQKEKFVGAVDCNKFFVRDLSLKPKALQDHSGIGNTKDECFLKSAQALPSVGGPPGGGVGGDCGPTPNFPSFLPGPIPPSVGAESPGSFPDLDSGTVVQTAKKAASLTGVPCELLIGIHYVEAGWH